MTDTEARAGTLHLLLVEDDDGDAVLVEELLSDAGLETEVTRAWSLEAAVDALAFPVDCILLDLGLPDATGFDALVRLRDASDAALVVLTGLDDAERGLEAVAAGAQDYLVKGSVDGEALGRAVRYAVERRRGDRDRRSQEALRARAEEVAELALRMRPEPHVPSSPVRVLVRDSDEHALSTQLCDVVERPDGSVLAVIGTVEGSGTGAAAVAATVRAAFRGLALSTLAAVEVLDSLDHLVRTHGAVVRAALVELVPGTRHTAVCHLAGHHAPLAMSPGAAEPLATTAQGEPLGRGPCPRPTLTTDVGDQERLLLLHDAVLAQSGARSGQGFATVLDAASKGWGDDHAIAGTVERVVRAYGPNRAATQFVLLGWSPA
ncbi:MULTISPECIES: SpoIIE family protein phosphatase [Georgenia]|uniref:SpoIIE family protein phosphatase n=1 Tax=Georgenia TaxID=154116 RepID=UPI00143D5098|nr:MULTISPECIES: response regulator [Georgenia]